jgi:hypothetical protein
MAIRLFSRLKLDDKDPVTSAEADLAHKIAERSRIADQLTDVRARLEAATQGHEAALLDEDPDKVTALAAERTDAQMRKSGLDGLLARINVEIAAAEVELASIRETAQRRSEADRLEAALADQAAAAAQFEPAADKLVTALDAMGASETARVLRVFFEQTRRQIDSDRASIELRAGNLRKPPPPVYVPDIATPPAPHGQIAAGSRYRGSFARG